MIRLNQQKSEIKVDREAMVGTNKLNIAGRIMELFDCGVNSNTSNLTILSTIRHLHE